MPSDTPFKDCRMYEQELPNQEDLVVVKVTKVEDFGAYVTLLEYGNIEGMILSSEVSRKRIRSIHKHLRIGKQDVMQVLRVDKEKGYIDLSKKYVKEEYIATTMEKFSQSKTVHSIMKHTAVTCKISVESLLAKVAWPLYEEYGNQEDDEEEHALKGLNDILADESLLDKYDLEENIKNCLLKEIKHRLAEQPFKIQAQIDVTCFGVEGVLAIKEALMAAKDHAEENNQDLSVNLSSTPTYRLVTQCTDKEEGIKIINKAIELVKAVILEKGGNFGIKEEPTAEA